MTITICAWKVQGSIIGRVCDSCDDVTPKGQYVTGFLWRNNERRYLCESCSKKVHKDLTAVLTWLGPRED